MIYIANRYSITKAPEHTRNLRQALKMPLQVEHRRRPSLTPQLEPLRRIPLECQGATPIEYGLPPLTYQTIFPPSPRRRPSEHQSPIPMDYGLPPPTYQTTAPPKQPTLQRKPTLPIQTRVQNVRSSGQKKKVMEFDRIRLIGQGGEGEAWLMRSVADNSLVVRKVFRDWPQKWGEPLEVKILNEILPKHCSLISLYYYSLKPEEHKLHMYYEYCSGGSLESLIPKGKLGSLPESFIWLVFIQLAEALEVLHYLGTQKVVHRDVKPDNVFLGIPYTPKPIEKQLSISQTRRLRPSYIIYHHQRLRYLHVDGSRGSTSQRKR